MQGCLQDVSRRNVCSADRTHINVSNFNISKPDCKSFEAYLGNFGSFESFEGFESFESRFVKQPAQKTVSQKTASRKSLFSKDCFTETISRKESGVPRFHSQRKPYRFRGLCLPESYAQANRRLRFEPDGEADALRKTDHTRYRPATDAPNR